MPIDLLGISFFSFAAESYTQIFAGDSKEKLEIVRVINCWILTREVSPVCVRRHISIAVVQQLYAIFIAWHTESEV